MNRDDRLITEMRRRITRAAGLILFLTMLIVLSACQTMPTGTVSTATSETARLPRATSSVTEKPTPEQHAPSEQLPVVQRGDTTVSLVRVDVTASHTVVEFAIEDPIFPQNFEAMYNLSIWSPLLPGEDLDLSGFTEEAVLGRRESRQAGVLRLVLELPPPANFEQPVVIEIEELQLLETETGAQRGQIHSLQGPWRFEFVPQVPESQRQERRILVDQAQQTDGIILTVTEVKISSTEAVVSYRLEESTNEHVEMLSAPRLTYQGQTFEGRARGGNVGDVKTVSFPVLPLNIGDFELAFGPFWVSRGDPVSFMLDVAKVQADGQMVRIGDYTLQFHHLANTPEGFRLTYVPTDVASAHFVLVGPGASAQITDNLDQHYTWAGANTGFDPEQGMVLKDQTLRVKGPLSEAVTQLRIQVSQPGKIVEPVSFQINTAP